MGLNKEEEEILKQIEQELMKDDPDLAKTVEDSTLSKFTRNRAVISFFVFVILVIILLFFYSSSLLLIFLNISLLIFHDITFFSGTATFSDVLGFLLIEAF